MSETPRIEVHQDFVQVYDLPDPRPYYRRLHPADYRMPAIVAAFLANAHKPLAEFFGVPRPRLLDFACGFGAVPALVHHDLTLEGLYAYYEEDRRDVQTADRTFYAACRKVRRTFEIGGLDIASNAVRYAHSGGLLDAGFDDDLLSDMPGPELEAFLTRTALIYECGAMLDILQPALVTLIDSAKGEKRPWLLYSPRFDVDDTYLRESLFERGYAVEIANSRPVRYRRSLGPKERAQHETVIRRLGRDPALGFDGDYLVLDMKLARPWADAKAVPVSRLKL